MDRYGILIDYTWCSGCRSCEIACQMEHNLPTDRTGVKVFEVGPWCIEEDRWQHDYVPVFTDECTQCKGRQAKGKAPSCVQHCQASILTFGTVQELTAKMGEKKQNLAIF